MNTHICPKGLEKIYLHLFYLGGSMTLNKPELDKLCRLAKLKCPEVEQNSLYQDINAIMNFVEQLRACNTDSIEPLFHPFELPQRNREDIATEESCLKELEAIAPLFEDGHYLVPKV